MDRRGGPDDWPTEGHLDRLCGRAAGLFVYAAATVKFIDTHKRDPKKQLDLLLQSQKIGDHEGKSLDSLYTSILRDAFGDDRPEDDAKTRSILGAVVLAANPLSPSTIAMLLGFDTEDVPLFLSSVNSLLILQGDVNHPVRPFHKSFPDFITNPNRCTNARFHISSPDHHAQLLVGCLSLMDRTLERNMCKLPDGVANSDVGDLKERTETYIDPALRYVCVSWHTHLVGLVDADSILTHAPTITPILHRFLETKLLFWLEVLSVVSAVNNAVGALQVIVDWLEVCQGFVLCVFPKLFRPDAGVTIPRSRQWLSSFCNRILRDHLRVLSTYLSLGTRSGPKEFDRTEAIRVIRPPFRKGCVWSTDIVGCKHRGHSASHSPPLGCVVTMQ